MNVSFEQRLNFRMFYFMKNDHEIIAKCRWGSGGAVSSAGGVGVGVQGVKAPKNVGLFTSGG